VPLERPCPFCSLSSDRIVAEGDVVVTLRDSYPVSPGHTLIVPRRHVASFFDTTAEEQAQILEALRAAKEALDKELAPAGYNIGVNDGAAAGQTVPHLHVHLIPRYDGDHADSRGGVRWVLPEKARYWE
jgi:diadenosine tetraphosphate (Ap4A) HIT family hydrolase